MLGVVAVLMLVTSVVFFAFVLRSPTLDVNTDLTQHAPYAREFEGRWPVRALLDAIQKSALFEFGLDAIAQLRQARGGEEPVASLYEAKYLVQLFRYDEANSVLERVPDSKEKRAVAFNIMLNLAQDDQAAEVARGVHDEILRETGTEHDFLILRNSVHLFRPDEARAAVTAALVGFEALDSRFGAATTRSNLGIVELASGSLGAARESFETARQLLTEVGSAEVYQPLVNLSAISLLDGNIATAQHLLSAARDAAPPSLLQDAAMFDLNAVALAVCTGDCTAVEAAKKMRAVVDAAGRTWDLRFRDVATWFAEALEALVLGRAAPPTGGLTTRIEQIRANGRVPLEVFISRGIGGDDLEVPYVLSPHWRY
jgi:tetratricopeptide (TPR) repeat protein